MKSMFIAASVAASLFAPSGFAQTKSFEGFSLGLNANSATASTEFTANNQLLKPGETYVNGSFQAEYGLPSSGIFNFGLGMTYALSDLKAGSSTTGGVTYELKQRDAYSLFVEPGFAVTNSALVYGKIAYLGMRGETRRSTGATQGDDFTGAGYGIGVRGLVDKNVFLQAEIMQNNYLERAANGLTIKPSSLTGTIGIGYKF